jgi:single-strand DNA-binding protein
MALKKTKFNQEKQIMNASNNCKFVGRLTKSPLESLKKLDNGNSFLTISIAVKSKATDKTGEAYERTDYPQLTLWNEKAESAALELAKGSLVEVSAQLQTRRYKAEDGQTWRYVTEFLVQSIQPKTSYESQPAESVPAVEPQLAKASTKTVKSGRNKSAAK